MQKYDYRQAVTNDILRYIEEEVDFADYESVEDMQEKLYDILWVEDTVTGNASGSYTFNKWEAEENICNNLGLMQEALHAFEQEVFGLSAEYIDVTIRCYVLAECLEQVLEDHSMEYQARIDLAHNRTPYDCATLV